MPMPPKDLSTSFHEKIMPEPNSGCWLWTGAIQNKGYGHIGNKTRGEHLLAHRVSWMLYHGPIPDGLCVLHKCDVTYCVSPDHLFLGTQADNLADMRAKKRHPFGEKNGMAKLTKPEVMAIRRVYRAGGVTQYKLADQYGVTQSAISNIVRYRRWSEA